MTLLFTLNMVVHVINSSDSVALCMYIRDHWHDIRCLVSENQAIPIAVPYISTSRSSRANLVTFASEVQDTNPSLKHCYAVAYTQ